MNHLTTLYDISDIVFVFQMLDGKDFRCSNGDYFWVGPATQFPRIIHQETPQLST